LGGWDKSPLGKKEGEGNVQHEGKSPECRPRVKDERRWLILQAYSPRLRLGEIRNFFKTSNIKERAVYLAKKRNADEGRKKEETSYGKENRDQNLAYSH